MSNSVEKILKKIRGFGIVLAYKEFSDEKREAIRVAFDQRSGVCQSKPRQELSKPHGGYIFLSNFEFSIVVRLVRCYNMQG